MDNSLIPVSNFIPGLNLSFNYNKKGASVGKNQISHVLNDGQTEDLVDSTYKLHISVIDFFNINNDNFF